MKVLTKCVSFENQEFVLIKDISPKGEVYYGTIPFTEIDERGHLKRVLNGFDMEISFNSISEALDNRRRSVVIKRLMEPFLSKGMDITEVFEELQKIDEYNALYRCEV